MSDSPESALHPLEGAAKAVELLRNGSSDEQALRAAYLDVSAAAEASLRRLLRDDPDAELPVRLRALAPDEMPSEELIADLRRRDRVPIELAALFHETIAARRRVAAGEVPTARDATVAVRLADRIPQDIAGSARPHHRAPSDPRLPDAAGDETIADPLLHAAEPPVRTVPPPASRASPVPERWIGAGAVLLLALLLGVWWWNGRDDGAMEQGIALFRSGDLAAAESQFQRHLESNPDDATPLLYLSRIHRRERRFDVAADDLRRALELAPDDAMLHRELGFLLLDTRRPAAAVDRFRAAIARDPEAAEGWIGLVRALRESGRGEAVPRVLARAPAEVRAAIAAPRSP